MSKELDKSQKDLPEKESDAEERLLKIQQITAASFKGPFPPPRMLAQYDEVLPGLADRIVTMAEKQSEHRREMEKEIVKSEINLASRGQMFAFSIAVLAMIATVTFAYLGQEITATVFGGATIVTLVTLFIKGKKSKEPESQKEDITDEILPQHDDEN